MFFSVTQALVDGLLTTFQIFIFTLLFSLPLGLILAFGAMSRWKVLRGLIQTLVWIIRGTPLMLQLIIIFTGPGCGSTTIFGAAARRDGSPPRWWLSASTMPAIFP